MAAPTPSLAGYQVQERVGSGTFADVYRAVRRADRRQVALKCVHRGRLNEKATDSIVEEIGLLKQLEHPNIVRLFDFACDKHYVYIVMELCAGGDLRRLIRAQHRLPESLVRQFLRQLALAMQFLHSRRISHMDLKPHNLLLTADSPPTLKVADFGFAKYLRPEDVTEGLRGSPLYMAPEILTKGQYGADADLWSIGVILYECLFGSAPYSSSSIAELVQKIKTGKPIQLPANSALSDECRDLLTRLLQRDPRKRITFEQFFQHPFVDLEHAPSKESLAKGSRVLNQAVEKDTAGELEEAIRLYQDGVSHLLGAVQYERDETQRAALRQKARDYVQRAEQLRRQLRPPPGRPWSGEAPPPDTDDAALEALSARVEPVRAALEVARSAVWYEREASWDRAMETYELAIQQLLNRVQETTDPKEKRLLESKVDQWLTRAETIRQFQESVSSPADAANGKHNKCSIQ